MLILLIEGVMKLAEEQPEQLDGLTPMGVQRLRELRAENNDLRVQVATLEWELEKVQSNLSPPIQEDGGEPSGPGSGAGPPQQNGRRRKPLKKAVGNVLFYVALVLALVMALFIRTARQGAPVSIAGYSGMLVLTESMADAIPKGSLIITKSMPPDELQIGDDITYMVNPSTSVTHRIVDIRPQASGTPIIQTKGLTNSTPDAPVAVENIVGKVVYHSLFLGLLAKGIGDNWPLLLFLLAVWTVLGKALVLIFREVGQPQGKRVRKTVHSKVYRAETL